MDLLNLGSQSRKTGIRPKKNLRKDRYNMEDIDEFFSEDDSDPDNNVKKGPKARSRARANPNSSLLKSASMSSRHEVSRSNEEDAIIARKINFTDAETDKFDLSPISISKNKRPPSKSPLLVQEKKQQKQSQRKNSRDDSDNDDSNEATPGSPIISEPQVEDNEPESPKLFVGEDLDDDTNNYDGLNDDLFNDAPLDHGVPVSDDRNVDESGTNDNEVEEIDLDDEPPEPQQSQLNSPNEPKKRKASSLTKNMALGLSSISKKKQASSQQDSRSREISVKPSPLPSPPPDGLRRSKRTRIQPLAFWRGERIVYTRADEQDADPDSTLINDIKKIPLQEIKEIIHVPALTSQNSLKRKSRRSKSKSESRSSSQTRQGKDTGTMDLSRAVHRGADEGSVDNKDGYDYESDPEVDGSEWFKEKQLKLDIFENNDSEALVNQSIAYSPDIQKFLIEPPKSKDSEIDNYKIAKIFDDTNTEKIAVAIMEFPHEGFKSSKSSGNCVYMFHVIKGLLEITLSNHSFVVTRGCSFQVPSGNTYGITNIGNGSGRVYCVQVMDE